MRNFTVGLTFALVFFLWASPKMALGFGLFVAISLLALPILPRAVRLLLVGGFAGVILAQLNLHQQLNNQFSANQTQRDFLVIGTVVSVPRQDDRRASFVFRIDGYLDENPELTAEQVRLSWYGPARVDVRAGDQWQLVVRLKPPASLGNPGGFNYARWLFQNRIHATGYVRDTPKPIRLQRRPLQLHALRQSLAENIAQLPAANDHSGLVQGLTVGVTNSIPANQWQTLRHSGTAHLLAISGLHIGLISGWFYLLAGFLWGFIVRMKSRISARWCSRPVFALAFSFFGASSYAALAGFSLPTQRALIMLSVFALSLTLRRIWPPGSALLFALLIVLLLDPLTVLSVGFWLSFGTVLALFYLHQGRLSGNGKIQQALHVHTKLGLVLLPATAWFFQQGAMAAPLANLLAVPFVGLLVVPLSFLVAVLLPVWPAAANQVLSLVQWLLMHLLKLLDWLLLLPGASVPLFLPGPLVLALSLIGLLILFAPRALRVRWLCVPLLAPAIVLNVLGKPVRGLEMHVLDVGQGLAVVLFTAEHTVLFDTGSRAGDSSMVDRVVQPFLIANGRSTIDIAIVSHADDDHAGGLDALLKLHPGASLFSSDAEHHEQYSAAACRAGHSFVLDEVTFSFLHPAESDFGSRNNQSCVLLVHLGASRVLLSGDIEAEAEQILISRVGQALPLSVLVAPHHGSRSSSTSGFVSFFTALKVVFPAGERNRFGFPHADVVSRYDQIGAVGFVTGLSGAVSMRFDRTGLRGPVEQYWSSRRRYRR